jgi:hypothetical protein
MPVIRTVLARLPPFAVPDPELSTGEEDYTATSTMMCRSPRADACDTQSTAMDLLVFYPTDPHPKSCQFTGPLSLVLEQAIGGQVEEVPGFNSISCDGVVRRCTAYCDKDGKQHGLPMNTWATALWHVALQRQGYERV